MVPIPSGSANSATENNTNDNTEPTDDVGIVFCDIKHVRTEYIF